MGPNIRKPVMDDESSTDTSSEPRFHPPGQGGVPLYSPSDTPAKLEKRSIASFTANPSSNPILSTGLQHNLSSQPNMRAIEGHNPPSQDSNLKHNPEPVTPVRSDPYSDQRVYNMAAPVAASSIGQSYGQHNNDCTQSSGAPMMLPALYIGPAPLVPMGDDKDSHPAVLVCNIERPGPEAPAISSLEGRVFVC
ncbi:hypothetical protein GQ53DRAFT_142864 [Thozetella sp. PMI_491]|nr:hypothetical protein GQ53DRAFT_142864 [Thozetella sp. PMI_491]